MSDVAKKLATLDAQIRILEDAHVGVPFDSPARRRLGYRLRYVVGAAQALRWATGALAWPQDMSMASTQRYVNDARIAAKGAPEHGH